MTICRDSNKFQFLLQLIRSYSNVGSGSASVKVLHGGVTRAMKFWQINEVTMIILHVKEWCKLHPSVEWTYFLLLSLNEETAISIRPQVDVILWRHQIFDFKLNWKKYIFLKCNITEFSFYNWTERWTRECLMNKTKSAIQSY